MQQRLDYAKVNPGIVQAMRGLERQIAQSDIEKPLAELVRLRASQINGCAFCVHMHASDARAGGETEARLDTLVAWRESPFFTARERAALEWTESLTLIAETHVPDASWEAVRSQFSDKEVTDLTLLIVAINGWNRLAISFRKLPG